MFRPAQVGFILSLATEGLGRATTGSHDNLIIDFRTKGRKRSKFGGRPGCPASSVLPWRTYSFVAPAQRFSSLLRLPWRCQAAIYSAVRSNNTVADKLALSTADEKSENTFVTAVFVEWPQSG
jgi:hypothetical protein